MFLNPTGKTPAPTKNCALREIASRLESESDRLRRLASEINFRDSLSAPDVSALAAQLNGTIAALTAVNAEIADSHSLALVDSAPPSAWTGAAIVAGGLNSMRQG